MSYFNSKRLTGYLTLVGVIFTSFIPKVDHLYAEGNWEAYHHGYECDDYEATKPGAWKWGALALAAAAGVGTGVAVAQGKKGHDGRDGPSPSGATGAAGAAGAAGEAGVTGTVFPPDGDETLTFNIVANIPIVSTTLNLTPYVTRPDGVTIEGLTLSVGDPAIVNFPPIMIDPALFGAYTVGVQVISPLSLLNVSMAVSADIIPSRTGAVMSIVAFQPVLVGSNETQYNAQFIYGENNVP